MSTNDKNVFGCKSHERTVVLVDGAFMAAVAKKLSWRMDYRKLLRSIESNADIGQAFYFSQLTDLSVADSRTVEGSKALKGLLDFLAYNGFVVETRWMRPKPEEDAPKIRGSMAVNIALRMSQQAKTAGHILLFAADDALVPAIEEAQREGCRVTVACLREGSLYADGLRRQANNFVDIEEARAAIVREV